MRLKEKVRLEICKKKHGIDVVLDNEKTIFVDLIAKFIETVSNYSDYVDEDILIKKIGALDIIRLTKDDDVCFLLDNINSSCNFYKEVDGKSYNGIILLRDLDEAGVHTFFHLLMHQIIENEVIDDVISHREFIDEKLSSKLKEGFIESFSEVIWNKAFPKIDCPGMEDDKYFAESQIMGIMIDIMGAKKTFDTFVTEPEEVINTLEATEYKGESLGDYLDSQLNNVVRYRKNNLGNNTEIINCVEAISDCSKKLNNVKIKVKR